MKRITMLVAVAVIFTCGFAFAEEEPGPNYEHLKGMEWMVGEWVHESKLENDSRWLGEKGEVYRHEFSLKWIVNKNALMYHENVYVSERNVFEERGMIGWKPEKKKIVVHGYGRGRGVTQGSVMVEDDAWKSDCREVSSSGDKVFTYGIVVKRIDENTITRQRTNVSRNGGEKNDWALIKLERKKEAGK